jgi:hypothetical protein
MYTGYDMEENTNWQVFLPSVAINTMRERYSVGGLSQLDGHPNKRMI